MTAMKKLLAILLLIPAALVAYLLLWPVPVDPLVWHPAADRGYAGPHAANQRLSGLRMLSLGADEGPEHVLVGPDGKIYTAVASGRILRMAPDGSQRETFAETGGRALGLDFDAKGRLIVADAVRGLLAITADRQVQLLTDRVDGDPIRYADAVVVARSGKIYFSDASMRFGPAQWGGTFEASVLDIIEQRSTGRVLEFDPASGRTRVLAGGLSFANGVALSADESRLLVAETGKYRVWTIPVAAERLDLLQPQQQARVLLDNLPGYPDNLMRGRQGRYWVALTKPRNSQVDGMADKPWLRKLTLRLPRAWWPVPPSYGHVIAFDESGRVLEDLQDPSGAYPETSGATETADRLYVHSLHAKTLGWLPR